MKKKRPSTGRKRSVAIQLASNPIVARLVRKARHNPKLLSLLNEKAEKEGKASLPLIYRRIANIALNSQNEGMVIKAGEFIANRFDPEFNKKFDPSDSKRKALELVNLLRKGKVIPHSITAKEVTRTVEVKPTDDSA